MEESYNTLSEFRSCDLNMVTNEEPRHNAVGSSSLQVWIPGYIYQISLYTKRRYKKDMIQRLLLRLMAAGVQNLVDLTSQTKIDEPIIDRAVHELHSGGYVNGQFALTEKGQTLLQDPYYDEGPSRQVLSICQVASTGDILAVLLSDDDLRRYRKAETSSRERGISIKPERVKTPTTVDVQTALLRARAREDYHAGEVDVRNPSIRLIGGSRQPCWMATWAHRPSFAKDAGDWKILELFGTIPSQRLRECVDEAVGDTVMKQVNKGMGGNMASNGRRTSVSNTLALHAEYDRAAQKLEDRYGYKLFENPKLHRYLFNIFAAQNLARGLIQWGYGDIQPKWAALSLYEPAVLNAGRACEEILNKLWSSLPHEGSLEGRNYSDGPKKAVDSHNRRFFRSLVNEVGFSVANYKEHIKDNYFYVTSVGKYAGKNINNKGRGLVSILHVSLFSAYQHKNHPLRKLAADRPNGWIEIRDLARFRNLTAHAGQEYVSEGEMEASIDTTLKLADIYIEST